MLLIWLLPAGVFGPRLAAAQEAGPEAATTAIPVVPLECSSPRVVLQTFLKRMAKDQKEKAVELLDLSKLNTEAATAKGPELAYKLFAVMQRLVTTPGGQDWPPLDEETAFENVPAEADYIGPWSLAELDRYAAEEAEEIQIGRDESGAWRFTAETVASIEALYQSTETREPKSYTATDAITTEPFSVRLRRWFPEPFRRQLFLLPTYQWICLLVIALLGWFFDRAVRTVLTRLGDALLHRREHDFEGTSERVWRPVGRLVNAATWYGGAYAVSLPLELVGVLLVVLKLVTVLAGVRAVFAVIDLLAEQLARQAAQTDQGFDDLAVPLVATTIKVLAALGGVFAFVAAFSSELPSTLLGGLGIGGVAIALASQETLSNFFGSVMVLFDRPFERGDWVLVEGIEGEVEQVGFRSTRIRTALNSQVTLPNSKLASASVDNWGRRKYRRYLTRIGVEYSTTPEQIEAFCEGVRELIRRQPHTRKDFYAAYFNDFGASALEVLLVVYFEVRDWPTELRERHRLLADIVRLAERLEIAFAFPTQTVHMFREQPKHAAGTMEDPEQHGAELAAEIAGELLNYQDRPGKVKFTGHSPSQGVHGRVTGD